MAKKSKLLAALDAHKGKDHKLEKQKVLKKKAERKTRAKKAHTSSGDENDSHFSELGVRANTKDLSGDDDEWESEDEGARLTTNGLRPDDIAKHNGSEKSFNKEGGDDVGQSEDDANRATDFVAQIELNERYPAEYTLPESNLGGDDDLDLGDNDGEDIPLSEIESISSSQKDDIVPHQRLTINNTSALLKAYKSIALSSSLPFSTHQTVLSAAQISISDIHDDLNRELAFYKQCLEATTEARVLLKKEGIPFTRPTDYFAEMVKSDEHMGKVKSKMTEEAASKRASAEARKQRDLKKFGKQVQIAKLQERDKAKKDTMEKINILKRKRKDADSSNVNEEDQFDVALEDASKADKPARSSKDKIGGRTRDKRQKKDEKFGYGGKKRFSKSGDAMSSGDLRGFSTKKMKGQKKTAQRLGKSRRAKS